jgi:hypothetical protein
MSEQSNSSTHNGDSLDHSSIGDRTAGDVDVDDENEAVLRTKIRRLEEENEQLRKQYRVLRGRRYFLTALGLAVVGITLGALGFVVIAAQEVLFALAATGLFGAVLTYFLTPERLVPIDVGEGIYSALASNEASIAEQLGLSSTRVYLTTGRGPRLFVPESEAYDQAVLDTTDVTTGPLVAGETASRSGLSLRPVAGPLLRGFEEQRGRDLSSVPREAVLTLREGVTDGLELATGVDTNLDIADGRVTFEVTDSPYGSPTQFDHPVTSFLGAGLATALETAVEVETTTVQRGDEETTLLTYRWDPQSVEESA